jgi:hypothetical protein
MEEPLSKSALNYNFSGKSHNKHPLWYNQPLRLNKEQKLDPLQVFNEFFQCYHLNEIREILWEWLTEVVSSPRSISSDSIERGNHMYFYEKMEELIEAAYVMKGSIHKHPRKWEKLMLKKRNWSANNQGPIVAKNLAQPNAFIENADNAIMFNKPKQLFEHVNETPLYVITEVFRNDSLPCLMDQLRGWLHAALSADCAIYEEGEQRSQLLSFSDQLLVLVEALFIIYNQNGEKEEKVKTIPQSDTTQLLSQDQIENPMLLIVSFFKSFPMVYIIRELNDWLEASICYAGPYPDNMSEVDALYTFRKVLCLVKSAKRLLTIQ